MSYNDFADKIRDRLGIEIEPVVPVTDWTKNMYFGPIHKPQTWQTNNKKFQGYEKEYEAEWQQPVSFTPLHDPWYIANDKYYYKDFQERIDERMGED